MEGCGAFVGGNLTWTDPETCSSICRRRVVVSAGLGSIWENIQKAVVRTPGVKGGLEDCPFCDKSSGVMTCDACKGSGADSLGECLMCTGKGNLKCSVCLGIGKVDVIRRGGTDDRNEYTKKGFKKRQELEANNAEGKDENA